MAVCPRSLSVLTLPNGLAGSGLGNTLSLVISGEAKAQALFQFLLLLMVFSRHHHSRKIRK